MKKTIILLVALMVCSSVMAQTHRLNLNDIPNTQFPCQMVDNKSGDSVTFYDYNQLSKSCSYYAQKKISNAETCLKVGLALQCGGAFLYGLSVYEDSPYLSLAGLGMVAAGGVLELVSVCNVVGHFKWEYRRKQVDMYLSPAGATIRF